MALLLIVTLAGTSILRYIGTFDAKAGSGLVYDRLLVSWDKVLHIVHTSLVGLIASGFNIAGYAKLLVSGNMVFRYSQA